jgi:glycosyltransferase involved in cell wall biosynthesis
MKILFVAPFLRIPADFGIAVRNYELLKHLTRRHQLTVIAYSEDETGQTDSWLVERGARVVRLPYSLPWSSDKSRKASLQNLFYYPPASFQRFSPQLLADAISTCLSKDPDVDVIVFDTSLAGQAVLKRRFGKPQVLIVHDIYDALLRREFQTMANRPFKLVKLINWLKTSRYERRILSQFKNLMAVSSADQRYLKEHFPKAGTYLVSNGVDTEFFSRNGHPRDVNTILFVGAFEYEPNVDAFFYFCREILPSVRAQRPNTQFVAVGRKPTAAMRDYAEANTGITLTGTVDDVRPFYGQASVVVVPLRVGSGMKLKTLEAFGMGVPVVSTSVGCEGLEVHGGVHCRIADNSNAFSDHVLDLLAEPDKAAELARRAQHLVSDRYDWKRIAAEFEVAVDEIVRSGGSEQREIEAL